MAKKLMIWYLLLSKRLFRKPSFLAVLMLAPLLTAGTALLAKEDAHILRIGVYAETSEDELGAHIVDELTALDGVIRYQEYNSENELRKAVAASQMDAGYLIPADLTELLREYASGDRSSFPYDGHLIGVVAPVDNIQLQLAREQFYSVLYPSLSQKISEQFALEHSVAADQEEDDVRKEIDRLYEQMHVDESIFQFAYIDSDTPIDMSRVNYLTSPLRGVLSLFVLLTGMASGLYLLRGRKDGMLGWVRYGYRSACEWICILTGTAAGGAAAYAALFFSGTFTVWGEELLLMTMLVLAVTGFCGILTHAVRSLTVFAACIPPVILTSAVLTPVFTSFHGLTAVKCILPGFYYLNSMNSATYRWMFLLYVLAVNSLYFILPSCGKRRALRSESRSAGRRRDKESDG